MEKIKEKLKSITLNQWHIAVIVIGIIFVSLGAFHSNLWFDESYSVGLARHTFGEIWSIGGHDVHPILYYWMLRIVYLITGGTIMAYRIFSVIPIAIMIILGYTHIRKDFGEKTGFIFSFLSAFLPEMAQYAIEIRMYSWAILAVTILALYAYRLTKEDNTKNWIIFGLSSLASIYLHYYGLMAAGLINVFLLIYLIVKRRKKGIIFIISFGILQGLAYLPWLVNFATQLSNVSSGYWIGFSFPKTPMELLSSQLAGYVKTSDYTGLLVPTVLALELYAYMIYKTYKYAKAKEDLNSFKWSVIVYFAVILAAIIITALMKTSILYYRYLFVITGLYIFAVSFILGKEENKIEIVAILSVIAILGVYNNIVMMKDNYDYSNQEPIKYLNENVKEGDTIVYADFGGGSVVAVQFADNQVYFYNADNWGVEEAYKAFGPNYEVKVTKDFIDNCSNRVWFVDNIYNSVADEIFEGKGYNKVSEKDFSTKYHDYSYKIVLLEK
jgi:ABC transporter, permease protein